MDWKNSVYRYKFIASFSGGKDSVLALYKAAEGWEKRLVLIVMLEEEGGTFRSMEMPLRTYIMPKRNL